jgi:hypothetical protein
MISHCIQLDFYFSTLLGGPIKQSNASNYKWSTKGLKLLLRHSAQVKCGRTRTEQLLVAMMLMSRYRDTVGKESL